MSLRKLNVLIGLNNSGKSNILDSLSFISEIVTNPLDRALTARGGYDHVVYAGDTSKAITMKITISMKNTEVSYQIQFKQNTVMTEEVFDISSNTYLVRRTRDGKGSIFSEKGQKSRSIGSPLNTSVLMYLSAIPRIKSEYPNLAEFLDFLQSWKFYKLNPSNLRTALDPRKEYEIGPDGKLMPLVLHTLLSENLPIFKEIERTLKSAVQEIEELQSPLTEDGRTHVAVRERPFKNSFDYHQLSDGILTILAHLLVIYSPTKAGLTGIEEPEDYVHPKLLKFIVDVLIASKAQIIIVTHSPYLLDAVDLKSIFIVRKIQGETTCKGLRRKKELRKFLKEFSLGELWVSGELENA